MTDLEDGDTMRPLEASTWSAGGRIRAHIVAGVLEDGCRHATVGIVRGVAGDREG